MKRGDVVSMGADASWLKVCECGQHGANRDCPVRGN